MQIRIARYFALPGKAERYLVTVQKRDGRSRAYMVEINPLHSAMHFLFTGQWSQYYVENFAWMVSFYPHERLLFPGSKGRFKADSAMGFNRKELNKLLVQGIGAVIVDFSRHRQPMMLTAVAIRKNLGRLYHRLFLRHARAAGYFYHQSYAQEALYVIEKQWKNTESAKTVRQAVQRRNCRPGTRLYV
ncbi:hypothetical protein ACMGGR_06005 [Erwinia sp. BNK-24-b]|uniref:hypothetical protein n=1 Tax=unclassified Erwinia TaxID=2622719 RepID=UPI0039BF803A